MVKKWYQPITEHIQQTNADLAFIIDTDQLLTYEPIQQTLQHTYPNILKYKSEIQLRRLVKTYTQPTLIIFTKQGKIPYDLETKYASLTISIKDIFPSLNKEILLNTPKTLYQQIYEKYKTTDNVRYEQLSKKQTKQFIQEIPTTYQENSQPKIEQLTKEINTIISKPTTSPEIWGNISKKWGELQYLIHKNEKNNNNQQLTLSIQEKFTDFIKKYYEDLAYYSDSSIHYKKLQQIFQHTPTALICFDCMSYEEWHVIKQNLKETSFTFHEHYSFSMLPSETKYSSTALFAGLPPKDIKTLPFINGMHWKNEERLFKNKLTQMNLSESDIFFQRCIEPNHITINNYNDFKDFKAIGIVFSFIDRFIHHNFLHDKNLIMKNINHIMKTGKLQELITSLLNQGFNVYLTSDHGNKLAQGNGVRVSKDLMDTNAKRYLIQSRKELLKEYETEDSITIQLKNINGNEWLLLQTKDHMYASNNQKELTHGGVSIEEVIVPFIEVTKK